jgi:hypothetical protein
MPLVHIQESFEIVNGGAVYVLDTETKTTIYRIFSTGSVTPVGTHSFTVSKATYEGLNFTFRYLANATLNSPVNITFFGTNMPRTLSNKNCTISAYHNGTSWDVQFIPDLDQTGTLPYDVLPPDESFTAVNAFGGASPAFANADYTSSGTTALGFRLRGDKRIEFRGVVDSAAGVNSQLFTLPAGYRSGRDKTYPFTVRNVTDSAWETMTLTINGTTSGTPGQVEVSGLTAAKNYKIYFDSFVAYRIDE